MTVTKNADGTFTVTFSQRQLELVVGRLGLSDGTGRLHEEEYALYKEFSDLAGQAGAQQSPLKIGLITVEDLSPMERVIAALAGEIEAEQATVPATSDDQLDTVNGVIAGQLN